MRIARSVVYKLAKKRVCVQRHAIEATQVEGGGMGGGGVQKTGTATSVRLWETATEDGETPAPKKGLKTGLREAS